MKKDGIDKKSFGNLIRQARKAMDMTGETLSRMCDVNPVFIRKIEAGNGLPSLPVFIKICNALETPPEFFLQNELEIQTYQDVKKECIDMLDRTTGDQLTIVRNVLTALLDSLQQEKNSNHIKSNPLV